MGGGHHNMRNCSKGSQHQEVIALMDSLSHSKTCKTQTTAVEGSMTRRSKAYGYLGTWRNQEWFLLICCSLTAHLSSTVPFLIPGVSEVSRSFLIQLRDDDPKKTD